MPPSGQLLAEQGKHSLAHHVRLLPVVYFAGSDGLENISVHHSVTHGTFFSQATSSTPLVLTDPYSGRKRRLIAAEPSHRVNAAVAASLRTFGNAAVAASLRLIRTRSLRLGSDAVHGVPFAVI